MKVSLYDVIYELNRRKINVTSLENLTDEGLKAMLTEVEIPIDNHLGFNTDAPTPDTR
jgi:hypothetical protein